MAKHSHTILFSSLVLLALTACGEKPEQKKSEQNPVNANATNLLGPQQRAMEKARAVEGQLQNAADQRLRDVEAENTN